MFTTGQIDAWQTRSVSAGKEHRCWARRSCKRNQPQEHKISVDGGKEAKKHETTTNINEMDNNKELLLFSLKRKLIFFQLLQPEELVDRSEEDKGSDAKRSNKILQTNFRQF